MSRDPQHIAAAYHGDQVIFVQEADPGDAVWGALWYKPSIGSLQIWFNAWMVIIGSGTIIDPLITHKIISADDPTTYIDLTNGDIVIVVHGEERLAYRS